MKTFLKNVSPSLIFALILKGGFAVLSYFIRPDLLTDFGAVGQTQNVLISYAPEVWFALLALVLGTLIIVISIAAESAPKLIDLFVTDHKSRFFVWIIALSIAENIFLQLHMKNTVFYDNLIFFNGYILLPLCSIIAIPYIYHILSYTKNSNVIRKIYDRNKQAIRAASRIKQSEKEIERSHTVLFESINQLHDLHQHIKFKEPKASVLHFMGKLLRLYIIRKRVIPSSYFKLSHVVKQDISFKTLKKKFKKIEEDGTFYEHKILRVLGTSYILLINDSHYDLASLCCSELYESGKQALTIEDEYVLDTVLVHFNTILRYGINHGLKTREIRNVYNALFHYGQLVNGFIEKQKSDRVSQCFRYLNIYKGEMRRISKTEPMFVFLIHAFTEELKQILVSINKNNFPREQQEPLLKIFNHMEKSEPGQPDSNASATKWRPEQLIQINLCLFYLSRNEAEYAESIMQVLLSQIGDLPIEILKEKISDACNRIEEEEEDFWEETDQGNLNIFYSPHKDQLPVFRDRMLMKSGNFKSNAS